MVSDRPGRAASRSHVEPSDERVRGSRSRGRRSRRIPYERQRRVGQVAVADALLLRALLRFARRGAAPTSRRHESARALVLRCRAWSDAAAALGTTDSPGDGLMRAPLQKYKFTSASVQVCASAGALRLRARLVPGYQTRWGRGVVEGLDRCSVGVALDAEFTPKSCGGQRSAGRNEELMRGPRGQRTSETLAGRGTPKLTQDTSNSSSLRKAVYI